MKKKIIILSVLITLTIISIMYLFTLQKEKGSIVLSPIELQVDVEVSSFDLIMFGDALIHQAVYDDAHQGNGVYDFSDMFTSMHFIKEYDLAYYNQETILGGDYLGLSTYPRFNTPQAYGDFMIELGFNLVSLANNHTMDKGEEAILNSIAYWRDKEVVSAGSYLSFEDRNEIKVYEKNGITYAFLSYTYGTNGIMVPQGKEYLVNVYNKEMLQEDIEMYRPLVDYLIVSMHWGDEYVLKPNQQQIEYAKFLADLDVDLVIGTHSHCVQPIEWIDDTLVVYSLGNMISGQDTLLKQIGGIVALKVNKVKIGDDTHTTTNDIEVDLVYTYSKNIRNYKLMMFDEITEEVMADKEKVYETYTSVLKNDNPDIKVGLTR